jgi:hemolysin activation/secretion protein
MAAASSIVRLITRAGVGLLVLTIASPARAQRAAAPITGNEVPQGSPLPRVSPPAPPEVGPGPAVPPPAQPNGNIPNASVAINSVSVDGATAYPAERLAAITAGLKGPATPLAKVEAARLAIVNLYRGDGYVLTTVTASIAAGGQLRFLVAEGYISDVKLEGDIGPAGTQVLRFLQHLTETRPINTATLERWLLLAQDVPGVTVHAVLRPSGTEPSALMLIAELNRQAVNGVATIDNRGFRGTGPVEALGVLDLNSFTQLGEKTEISLYRAEGDTQTFGQIGEEFFAGGSGLKLRLYYGHGEATPYGSVIGTNYTGYTTVFGASASYPLIRSRAQTLNLNGALDAIETYTVQASPTKDSLRIGRIGIDYALEDTLFGDDYPGVNTAVVRISRGLPFLGGSKYGNALAQRGVTANEDYDFTKLSFDASRTQTLFQPWENATIAFKARVTGQGSASVVPPAEKFFLGGPEFDRGYYAGQVTGDSALAYTAELQLNTGISVNVFGQPIDVGTQFYVFYDYGEVWQNVKQEANPHISSEGIGTRVTITRYTEFDLEGDIRNTRLPIGTAPNVKPLKADAVYWRVLTRF